MSEVLVKALFIDQFGSFCRATEIRCQQPSSRLVAIVPPSPVTIGDQRFQHSGTEIVRVDDEVQQVFVYREGRV